MPKKRPLIPPLSFEVLEVVEDIERYSRQALRSCNDTFKFNRDKAMNILRTCVVSVFDIQIKFYSSFHNFTEDWVAHVGHTVIGSAMGLITASIHDDDYEWLQNVLYETLNAHMKARDSAKRTSAPPKGKLSRKKLADSYFAKFPDETIKILDVCWAVGQHYREWKRWLKNELKEGSTPDLAFRRILTSDKRPRELNKNPRPTKWQ